MYKKMMKFKDYPEIAKEYPLILMTGSKLEMYTHSMMRNIPELYEQFPENLLKINPERAAKLEIEDGDVVSVESSRGRIECSAYVTDRIDPRVVRPYHGFAASNANVLTDNLHLLQNSGCEEINNFIQDLLFVDEDKGETVISLRKLVLQIAPSAKEEIKYSVLVFVSDKRLFCGIFIRKVIYLLSLIEVPGCKTQIIFLKAAEKIGNT